MFRVLFITFSGVALGYFFRKVAILSYLGKSITYTIWLLLFFFGLQVGANELVVMNLDTLGLKAFAIATAGSLGSCCAAWVLYKFVFSKGGLPDIPREPASNSSVPTPQSTSLEPSQQGTSLEPSQQGTSLESSQQGTSLEPSQQGTSLESSQQSTSLEPPQQGICRETSQQGVSLSQFMGGFVVVAFFAVGCVCGWLNFIPAIFTDGVASMYVLYFLMIQVGMSIGSDRQLKEIIMSLKPRLLLLPAGTIAGTLMFVAAAGMFLKDLRIADTFAVGAGFGYYSLSSVLITQIKEASAGASFAALLGTIALMSNIMREVITLLFAPVICKIFGKLAPISVGGATSMDSTLPVITSVCGKEMVFISIFHGVLVDFSVPFLVTFFASL